MKNKFLLLFTLLMVIIVSFPSICFSEMKTVTGEYCDVYLGDMKNKKELDEFRNTLRRRSIENVISTKFKDHSIRHLTQQCVDYVTENFLEKVIVISHTGKNRKICFNVKITSDPEVINQYYKHNKCIPNIDELHQSWDEDIDTILWTRVLDDKISKLNMSLIIETKIPNIEEYKREQLENEQEKQFFDMIKLYKDEFKYVDRRHLKTIIEEQKLSSSGLTDSDTVKLGKLLNLDIIVLRLIYENSQVTKVLKVDTGEVLLFKTYKTE